MKIKVINGPNLNMLGIRKKEVYGIENLDSICEKLKAKAEGLGLEISFFQSNHEGAIIDSIQECFDTFDGVIINPGAFSHYSFAIRDAIEAISLPVVEVHISNIYSREEFRHHSVVSPVCVGTIAGLGAYGYELALDGIITHLTQVGITK